MCGLPHHSIAQPICKLLAHGLCIAICDQLDQPNGRGLVKRAVTRILSPGMVYDLETLDQLSANYICAFDAPSISFLDTSTGSAFYYEILNSSEMFKLLEQFQPSELVVTPLQKERYSRSPAFQPFTLSVFDKILSHSSLLKKYSSYPRSVQRLLSCVISRQGNDPLKFMNTFEKRSLNQEMYYSRQLYSHLEIFKNYENSSKDTLFSTINRTKTACGARLLKKRLQSPLINKNKIESRLDKIEYWIKNTSSLDPLRKFLAQMGDGERKLGKIVQPNCNAKDLLAVAEWLDCGLSVSKLIHTKEDFKGLNTSTKL